MKKLILAILISAFATPAFGADIVLQITIPDAWVQRTNAAFNSTPVAASVAINGFWSRRTAISTQVRGYFSDTWTAEVT